MQNYPQMRISLDLGKPVATCNHIAVDVCHVTPDCEGFDLAVNIRNIYVENL